MAKIHSDTTTFGGKLAAELVNDTIALKAKGVRLAALLKETTVDGAATINIAVGGTQAAVFGVESGQGGNYYNAFVQTAVGIITILNTINSDKLADVDMGG